MNLFFLAARSDASPILLVVNRPSFPMLLQSPPPLRVEQPDVNLEEDEWAEEMAEADKENEALPTGDTEPLHKTDPAKLRIKFELYKKLSELLIRHCR